MFVSTHSAGLSQIIGAHIKEFYVDNLFDNVNKKLNLKVSSFAFVYNKDVMTVSFYMLQARNDDLQQEYSKLQNELDKLNEDNKNAMEENLQEFQQTKQQCENDIAKLKGELGINLNVSLLKIFKTCQWG